MTKKELLNLLESGEGEIKLDTIRTLQFTKGQKLLSRETVDYIRVVFESPHGEVKSDYLIDSREPQGIVEEIKVCTENYFTKLAKYLNGNKFLANNW